MEAKPLGLLKPNRIVMGPPPRGKEAGQLGRLVRRQGAKQQFADALPNLVDRLFTDVGENESIVVHLGDRFFATTFSREAAGYCPSCGSTGPNTASRAITISSAARAMSVPRHGIVRHEDRHLPLPMADGMGDLERGQDQSARGMQYDVDRHLRIGQLAGAQDILGIVNVDIPHDRKAEHVHRLLPVDQEDNARAALMLDLRDEPPARAFKKALLQDRLERREDEEEKKRSPTPMVSS